jgi:hypothetical protein
VYAGLKITFQVKYSAYPHENNDTLIVLDDFVNRGIPLKSDIQQFLGCHLAAVRSRVVAHWIPENCWKKPAAHHLYLEHPLDLK